PICLLFSSSIPPPPSPTLFPYTTLFRSQSAPEMERLCVPLLDPSCGASRACNARRRPEPYNSLRVCSPKLQPWSSFPDRPSVARSEEHTSELQSRGHLVCRLLLEKKKCN